MKRKFLFVGGIFVALVFLVYFAVSSFKIDVSSEGYFDEDKVVIGLSVASYEVERWISDRDYFVQECELLGAKTIVVSANGDPDLQVKQAENLIYQGVDVLVVIPRDAEIAAEIIDIAHENGVKVISYDRLILNSDVDYYITFDNIKVGKLQAEYLLKEVPFGKYAYVGGSLTDNNALMFKVGVMDVLQSKIDSGDVELVFDNFTKDWMTDIAYEMMSEFFSNGGTVDAVIAANDGLATGVIHALLENDLVGEVAVSGQDASLAGVQHILAGEQTMTVYKSIRVLANEAAKLAVAVAKDEKIETNDFVYNGAVNVPTIFLDVEAVTKDNINETVIADGFHSYEDVYG